MTRPQGEPTYYLPLWVSASGDYIDRGNWWRVGPDGAPLLIPAERVTITPEPYTPKVGDRVMTTLGYDVTILAAEVDPTGRIAVRFHLDEGDRYGTLSPSKIDGSVQ